MKRTFIHLKIIVLLGIAIILQASKCAPTTSKVKEDYVVYIGEHPSNRTIDWTENTQGVTHDNRNWYLTQTRTLWKIPVSKDLNTTSRNTPGIKVVDIQNIPQLWSKGYDHFGDLCFYQKDKGSYLFIPVEDDKRNEGGSASAIAVFDATDLCYIAHAEVGTKDAPWCAVAPNGSIYLSETGDQLLKMTVDWSHLWYQKELRLSNPVPITLLDVYGTPLSINTPQGGVITSSGNILYLSAGYVLGALSGGGIHSSWGIHMFDLSTGKRINWSQNGTGPFNFQFNPSWDVGEEPEGMTIWDLDDESAPGISGQLHVLLLDNDASHDDIHFKHYTREDSYPVLYENDNYGGLPVPVRKNIPSLSEFGLNDKATAIWIPYGWKVELYEHNDYKGKSVILNTSQSNLNLNLLGDEISSVKVYPPTSSTSTP